MTRKNGFTLIELVVSIGIAALLLALGLPAYRSFGVRGELTSAADEVRAAILETQGDALAPRVSKPSGVDVYSIAFPTTGSDYTIKEGTTVLKSLHLKQGIVFANAAAVEISYSIVEQGRISAPATIQPIQLKHTRLTTQNIRLVRVNRETGQVTIGEN